MKYPLSNYHSIVFDCDGVVLDSNGAKIDAYRQVALSVGASAQQAEQLVQHHIKLGGISRYPKFEFFLREIMQQPVTEQAMHGLLERFTVEVQQRLLNCTISPHLDALRAASKSAKWMILSGGDQVELRKIFQLRGLSDYFPGGIFGSPDNKDQVLAREMQNGNIVQPALFIGDSRYDFQAASAAGLDFVFLTDWTDMQEWQGFCRESNITVMNNLGQLLDDKYTHH